MSDEFDINKIAAEFTQHNLEKFVSAASSGIKNITAAVRASVQKTYRPYIQRVLERYGRGKSFFIRTEATPLYSFFVPLNLRNQLRILEKPDAVELTSYSPYSIIVGSGGSGKSMCMRHLLVSSIAHKVRTPVFIELRQINQTSDTLLDVTTNTLRALGLEIDDVFVLEAMSRGQFFFLLDGFDELERSARHRIAREVQELVNRYPKNLVVMSSRPDPTLNGWEPFAEYRVEPLSLSTASELVTKLPFDEDTKQRFLVDLRESLFEKHESFLSNPLLLSIMLLTYSDVAHIPEKLSTFYSQAYEALFYRHDALKSGPFQRERQTKLDINEFARAFSAFSLLSYDGREFSFSRTRALELVTAARDAAMLEYDAQAYLDDAVQANCLLIEEGLNVIFAHRSFQEYFVARFIHASPPEVKAKLVTRYAPIASSDSVMALLWEIDPYIVEKHYILPGLQKIRESIGMPKKLGKIHLLRYLRLVYEEFNRSFVSQPGETVVTRVGATARNEYLADVGIFAFTHYRDRESVWGNRNDIISEEELNAAFEADHGSRMTVRSDELKARGHVITGLAERGVFWSLVYLRILFLIEREITEKHNSVRESLDSLLSSSRRARTHRER